jgi:hypothetical protein
MNMVEPMQLAMSVLIRRDMREPNSMVTAETSAFRADIKNIENVGKYLKSDENYKMEFRF